MPAPQSECGWLRATAPCRGPSPNRSDVSNPYHLSSWNQPTGKGVNAGLRAQAGGPLGLSWGLPGLNLFWKQRKKPESCCGQIGRGFSAPHITLVAQGDLGTILKSLLPPGPAPSHPPHNLPSPTADTSLPTQSTPGGVALNKAGSYRGLFFQEALFICLFNTIFHL